MSKVGNPAGLLLLALVMIFAVVVIWVALMIRKMMIIISAVFAPVAFSGAASDASRSWVRRWIEFTVALVFSKLILVIIFMIGLSVLDGAGDPHDASTTAKITNLCVGALTLLLAGFAPWLAIKMVHFAGTSLQTVHTHATSAAAGGRTAISAPRKVASVASIPVTAGLGAAAVGVRASGAAFAGGQAKAGGSSGIRHRHGGMPMNRAPADSSGETESRSSAARSAGEL